jgi:hypothetical protein
VESASCVPESSACVPGSSAWPVYATPCYKSEFVLEFVLSALAVIRVFFAIGPTRLLKSSPSDSRSVAVLKRKRPRPTLNSLDRLFWTSLRGFWSRWSDALVIVKPETVIGWHRAGFRLYWRCRSRPRGGRPTITEEIRVLIRRLAEENQDWARPRSMASFKNSACPP